MKKRATRKQVRAWMARWSLVNHKEREELRMSPLEMKFRHLTALMASVKAFGWDSALSEGEAEVRERWIRLRSATRG